MLHRHISQQLPYDSGLLQTCEECQERPVFFSEDDLKLHKLQCHQVPCPSISSISTDSCSISVNTTSNNSTNEEKKIVSNSKKIKDLLEAKQKLKAQLNTTKGEIARLDDLAGTHENTVQLLKYEVGNIERKVTAKNIEIDIITREKRNLEKANSLEDKRKQERRYKAQDKDNQKKDQKMGSRAESFRKQVDSDVLALFDSMEKVTGHKSEFKNISSASSADEIRSGSAYKTSEMNKMFQLITTLQKEVAKLNECKKTRQESILAEQNSSEKIQEKYKSAKIKLKAKTEELQECKLEINRLKHQLSVQEIQIEAHNKECTKYQSKYRSFKDKAKEGEKKVVGLEGQVSKLSRINYTMEERLRSLKESLTVAEKKIKDGERSVSVLTDTEKALKLKINRISLELTDKSLQMEKLEVTTIVMQNKKQEMEKQIQSLENEREYITRNKREIESEKKSAIEKECRLQKQICVLEEEKDAIICEKNTLEKQLRKLNSVQLKERHINQQQQVLLEKLQKQKENVDTEKVKLKREYMVLNQTVMKMKKNEEKKEEDFQNAKIHLLESKKGKLEAHYEKLQIALTKQGELERQYKENSTGSVVTSMTNKDDTLTPMEYEKTEEENKQLKQEIDACLLQLHSIVNDKKQIKHEYKELELEKKVLIERNKVCENRIQELTMSRNNIVKESKELREQDQSPKVICECSKIKFSSPNEDELRAKNKELSNELTLITENFDQSKADAITLDTKINKMVVIHQKLEDELIRVSNIKISLEEEQNKLKASLSDVVSEKDSLTTRLHESEAKRKILDNHLKESRKEYENLKTKAEESENESAEKIKQLKSLIEEAETKNRGVLNEINATERAKYELQGNLKESEEMLDVLTHKLSKSEASFKEDTYQEIQERNAEIQERNAEIQEQSAEIQKLKLQLEDGLKKQIGLRDQLQECEKEKSFLNLKLQESCAAQDKLRTNLTRTTEEKSTKEKELQKLKTDLVVSQKEKLTIQSKLEEAHKIHRKLQVQIDNTIRNSEDSNEKNEEIQKWKDMFTDCEKDKHELRIELEESLGTQRTLQIQLDEKSDSDCEEENANKAKDVRDIQDAFDTCNKENSALQLKLDASLKMQQTLQEKLVQNQNNDSSNEKDNEVQKLREIMEDCQKEKQCLIMELEESLETQRALQTRLDENYDSCSDDGKDTEKEQEIQKIRERLDGVEKEKHELKIELEESLGTQRTLQAQINENDNSSCDDNTAKEEVEMCKRELAEVQQELEHNKKLLELQDKSAERDSEEIQSLQKQVADLKKQLNDSSNKSNLGNDTSSNVSIEKHSEAPHKEEQDELKKQLKVSNEELDKQSKQIIELSKQVFEATQNENDAAVEHANLRQEVKNVEHENTKYRREIKELKEKELEEKNASCKKTHKETEELKDDLKRKNKSLYEHQEQVRGIQDEMKLVKKKLSNEQNLLKELERSYDDQMSYVNNLKREKTQLVEELKKERDNLKDTEGDLEEAEEGYTKLTETCKQLQTENEELKKQNEKGGEAKLQELQLRRELDEQYQRCEDVEQENDELKNQIEYLQKQDITTRSAEQRPSGGLHTTSDTLASNSKKPIFDDNTNQLKKENSISSVTDWGKAYRSYNKTPDIKNEAPSNDEAKQSGPSCVSSDDSLHLKVTSQMSYSGFNRHKKTEQSYVGESNINNKEESDESDVDIALCNSFLAPRMNRETDPLTAKLLKEYDVHDRGSLYQAASRMHGHDNTMGEYDIHDGLNNPPSAYNFGTDNYMHDNDTRPTIKAHETSSRTSNEKKKGKKKKKDKKEKSPELAPLPPVRGSMGGNVIPPIGGSPLTGKPLPHVGCQQNNVNKKQESFMNKYTGKRAATLGPLKSAPMKPITSQQHPVMQQQYGKCQYDGMTDYDYGDEEEYQPTNEEIHALLNGLSAIDQQQRQYDEYDNYRNRVGF